MAGDFPNPSSAISSFTCGSCGAPVVIRAAGFTVYAICPACGSTSENENGDFKLVQTAQELIKIHPLIPLGTKGKLRGKIYQVIGFMRRSEKAYPDEPWDEYLLFNPTGGFCWLVESKGHWNLFKMTKSTPQIVEDKSISFLGDNYQVFHRGNAVVNYVIGEFYWKVRAGHMVITMDAICPPHMLSQEKDGTEVIWSMGEYLEPSEVETAFHPTPMPTREGVAPNQPTSVKSLRDIWAAWVVIMFIFAAIQIFGKSLKPARPVAGPTISVPVTGVTDTEIAKFSTEGSSTHITIDVSASVNQSWTSVSLRVVPDDPTQTSGHAFEKDLSFYSGYSDGEAWSEGDQHAEFLVNGLPRGGYRVLLTAVPEAGHPVNVMASVIIAPSVWSNFWLAVFLLTLPPAWMSFRSRSFEKNRWSDSEYNMFTKSEES